MVDEKADILKLNEASKRLWKTYLAALKTSREIKEAREAKQE